MFTVPGSSSPPATPNKRNPFALTNPSTTPAGPPPTSFTAASTTPAGLPPSSIFGSVTNNHAIPFPASSNSRYGSHGRSPHRFQPTIEDDGDEAKEGYEAMEEDQIRRSSTGSADDIIPSIEGLNFSAIAKSLAMRPAPLAESGNFIISTERVIENVSNFIKDGQGTADDIDAALSTAVEELLKVWRMEQRVPREHLGIGPGGNSSPFTKAMFLSSLLLAFHHPPRQSLPPGSYRSSRNATMHKPIPEALLGWLKECHNQFSDEFTEVLDTEPNVCAHPRFWDVVLSSTLRGNLSHASQLLTKADFRYAASAQDEDDADEPGYRGKQLGNIQRVVNRAMAVLDSCPAVQSGNWNVKDNDWAIFRKRVGQALTDLESFAEGTNIDRLHGGDKAFEAENFGLTSIRDDELSISTISRRAESKVPWFIYQSLVYLYGQLLGYRREIVAAATDWVEATIGLTVWWDGEESNSPNTASVASRISLGRSQGPRQVDVLPRTAYQQKLGISLRQILAENEEPDLQVNTTNAIEVGIACMFEGDIQAILEIVRGWSSTISTTVVEIASMGSWLNTSSNPSRSLMDRFDQSDLMVLSFHQNSEKGINCDDILISYANQVCERQTLHCTHNKSEVEGWELAVQILGRLSNTSVANKRIEALFNAVELTAVVRIEKILGVCATLNLPKIGAGIAKKYADYLAATSHNYGNALYYYARAHNVQRIKDLVNVLVTSCLVRSAAYPAVEDLDNTLTSIIKSPKQTLAKLAMLDRDAANFLSANISGYAMIRRFYNLRDQETDLKASVKSPLRSLARRKEAAATLVTLIESAADSIDGGLYDASVESVVQVDGLLALLGESLVFFNQQKRILTSTQIFVIMQAAEDISTVSPAIYSQCEECLKSTMAYANNLEYIPSPRTLLARSNPSLSASNTFAIIGSGFPASSIDDRTSGMSRKWDWRTNMKQDAKGEDVLKILRLELAREISKVWTEGNI